MGGNLAMGYLKNKEFYQAISFCNKVLEREPGNVKALYRKASAHVMGSQFPEARATLKELMEIEPDNAGAKQMLLDIKRKEESAKVSSKKAAAKMFKAMHTDHDPRIVEEEPDFMDKAKSWLSCSWCRRRKSD